ncbi:MAG: PAS domain S-box protein, partial [Acidobacteria bacterium]
IVGLRGTVQDITERMRADEERQRLSAAVQRERDTLSALINSMTDEIWFADTEKRLTLVNPAVWKEFGAGVFQADQVERIAASFEVYRPDGTPRPVDEAPPLRALRGETVTDQEETVRSPASGQLRHRLVNAAPVRDAGGAIIGSVSVVRDITARKRAEEELQGSRHRLMAAIEIAALSVWEYRPDTDVVEFDQRSSEIFGTGDRNEMTIEEFLALVHEKDRPRVADQIRRALDPAGDGLYDTEYRVVRPDAVQRWLAARGHAIFTGDRQSRRLVRAIGTVMDITTRKQSEEALEKAKAAAEEDNRQKDHFLAVLGHELRNPLAPISTAAALLKRIGPPDPTHRRSCEIIDRQVAHMTRLIDDLLDVSRIARGKITLRREELDLTEIVQRAVEDHRPLLESRGLTLHYAAPPVTVCTLGDAARVTQIVGNLLVNAGKFTDRGGHVEVSLEVDGGQQVVIRVRDSGIGIDGETMARLFQPFAQADRSIDRSGGGLGLGLALVKGLVDLHGGHVQAFSGGAGRGAEFVVRVPAVLRHAHQVATPAAGIGPVSRRQRILVIEDNHDAAESLKLLLELSGN